MSAPRVDLARDIFYCEGFKETTFPTHFVIFLKLLVLLRCESIASSVVILQINSKHESGVHSKKLTRSPGCGDPMVAFHLVAHAVISQWWGWGVSLVGVRPRWRVMAKVGVLVKGGG